MFPMIIFLLFLFGRPLSCGGPGQLPSLPSLKSALAAAADGAAAAAAAADGAVGAVSNASCRSHAVVCTSSAQRSRCSPVQFRRPRASCDHRRVGNGPACTLSTGEDNDKTDDNVDSVCSSDSANRRPVTNFTIFRYATTPTLHKLYFHCEIELLLFLDVD